MVFATEISGGKLDVLLGRFEAGRSLAMVWVRIVLMLKTLL